MMSSQHVKANSSWNAVYPYSLSSAVSVEFEDFTENSLRDDQISDVVLKPVDGEEPRPATVSLQCENGVNIGALCVLTNARHMEVYDDRGQYIQTVRGEKKDNEEMPETAYRKMVVFTTPLPSCSMKFVSLADKGSLKVYNLGVTINKKKGDGNQSYRLKKQIDMEKVREMLSSMSNPVPENVEHLMQTVERYQQNQSSVWSEMQQQAVQSAARNPSAAAPMAGMLNMLARAGQRSGTGEDTNTMSDAMSKMMASMAGGRSSDRELYNSLQGICRNVSQMRVDERKKRQQKETSAGESSEKEATGTEKEVPNARVENSSLHESLAQVVAVQLATLEERMMGRLERRLDEIESRLELRLNRIESIVEDMVKRNGPMDIQVRAVDTEAVASNRYPNEQVLEKGSNGSTSIDNAPNSVGSDSSLHS